jgi:hypothetical protein
MILALSRPPVNAEADFDAKPDHTRFLVAKNMAVDRLFSECLRFHLSVSFRQCSIFIFVCMLLLPERQAGKTSEPAKEKCPL